MKKLLLIYCLIISTAVIFTSCAPRKYIYSFQMTHPIKSNHLEYENDTFQIIYEMKPRTIAFNLYNKSQEGLKINWDEVSLAINGKALRVVHRETGQLKLNDVQPPTTIPPHSKLDDFIIPTDNIRYLKSGYITSSTVFNEMFPTVDYGKKKVREKILNRKGERISIYLPFYMGNKFVSMYYNIEITDIQQSKKK